MLTVSPERAARYFEEKLEFTLGPGELNEMMKRGERIRVIDVRRAEDYQKGHIPGAMNMPKGTWSNTSKLGRDEVNIVYCYTEVCHLSASAAKEFAEKGYPVMELEGGFETWQEHKLPVER
jgi:rhodanese-related sulfurtransferase